MRKVHPGSSSKVLLSLSKEERESLNERERVAEGRGLSRGVKRLAAVIVALLVVAAVAYAITASVPRPRIHADHLYYDIGRVPQTKVSHTFTFGNVGNADLTVTRIWASCDCTTAKMVLNGVESPEFGMPGHGGYTGPWQAKLRPGEVASLVVYYNSVSMPDYYQGERYVFVDSDDPAQPELQFTIQVQEIP